MKNAYINKDYIPGVSAIDPNQPANSPDAKTPPLETLYPNKKEFIRINPQRFYSRDYQQKETEMLWPKTWLCAGFESDIPKVNNWMRFDIDHESFVIIRQKDHSVRAFYNQCTHRGRRLAEKDFGSGGLVCPFHSWSFNTQGENIRVTDAELFTEDALCGDLNLKEVRCETWSGLVFINQDTDAMPLHDYLGDVKQAMSGYGMEDMFVVKDVVIELDCNWKILLEAFLESYHLHITHPQATPIVEDVHSQLDFYAHGHCRDNTPLAVPSPREHDRETVNPLLQFMLMDVGIDPATFTGNAMDVRQAIIDAKRKPDNVYGIDYSQCTDSQLVDDANMFVFPNITFNPHPEGILIMRFYPNTENPEKCFYHVNVLAPEMAEGKRPPAYQGVEDDIDTSGKTRPARRYTGKADPQLGEVLEQDVSNVEAVQQGLRSKAFACMRYSEQEQRLQQFHAEMEKYIPSS